MADPYSFILTESCVSNSQEELLMRIPDWEDRASLLPPSLTLTQTTQCSLQRLSASDDDTDEDNKEGEDAPITASHLPCTLHFASPDSQLHVENDSCDHALESDRSRTPSPKRTWDPFDDSFASRIITQSQGEPRITASKCMAMLMACDDGINDARNGNVGSVRGHGKGPKENAHITEEGMECAETVENTRENRGCVIVSTRKGKKREKRKGGTMYLHEQTPGSFFSQDANETQGFEIDTIIKEEVVEEEQQNILSVPAEEFSKGVHLKTPKSEPVLNMNTPNSGLLTTDLQIRTMEENIGAEIPQVVSQQDKLVENNVSDEQSKLMKHNLNLQRKSEDTLMKEASSILKKAMHDILEKRKAMEETHVTNSASGMNNQKLLVLDHKNLPEFTTHLLLKEGDLDMSLAESELQQRSVSNAQAVIPGASKDHNLVKCFPDTLMDVVIQSSGALPSPQPDDPDLLTVFMSAGVELDLSCRDCSGQYMNTNNRKVL